MKLKVTAFLLIVILLLAYLYTPAKTESKLYMTTQWVDLMPKEVADALYNPPEVLLDIPEELESKISKGVLETLLMAKDSKYQEALTSTKVIKKLNNQNIQIPGFVVPVEINEVGMTTGFFIVPYFGACLHYPPPPPNQTIYAEYSKGFDIREIYRPFVFKGKITITTNKNKIAESAYHLETDLISVFED